MPAPSTKQNATIHPYEKKRAFEFFELENTMVSGKYVAQPYAPQICVISRVLSLRIMVFFCGCSTGKVRLEDTFHLWDLTADGKKRMMGLEPFAPSSPLPTRLNTPRIDIYTAQMYIYEGSVQVELPTNTRFPHWQMKLSYKISSL